MPTTIKREAQHAEHDPATRIERSRTCGWRQIEVDRCCRHIDAPRSFGHRVRPPGQYDRSERRGRGTPDRRSAARAHGSCGRQGQTTPSCSIRSSNPVHGDERRGSTRGRRGVGTSRAGVARRRTHSPRRRGSLRAHAESSRPPSAELPGPRLMARLESGGQVRTGSPTRPGTPRRVPPGGCPPRHRVNVRWVTPLGVETASTSYCCSKASRPSHSRTPRPSRIGTRTTCRWSTRPRRWKARRRGRSPTDADVLAGGCVPRPPRVCFRWRGVEEVERSYPPPSPATGADGGSGRT